MKARKQDAKVPNLPAEMKGAEAQLQQRHAVKHIPSAPAPRLANKHPITPGHSLISKSGEVSLYVRMVAGAPLHNSVLKNAGRDKASRSAAAIGAASAKPARAGCLKDPRLLARCCCLPRGPAVFCLLPTRSLIPVNPVC
jgi:hypothetical protein